MRPRIGIDTGGTFTDCVSFDQRGLVVHKLRSTPEDPSRAIVEGMGVLRAEGPPPDVVHGSTVATNAVLERRGARVALVATAGFEDVLRIGRQTRPALYDVFVQAPRPLVDPDLTFGMPERVDPAGTVLVALDLADVDALAAELRRRDAEVVAVCLLHAYANASHERQIAERLRERGFTVVASHEILSEYREYERWSTTAVSAYVTPIVDHYLGRLQASLGRSRLLMMQSNGGAISADTARVQAVRTVLSGPAAGVVGAHAVAARAGLGRIITFDMGGTSTDVSVVDGAIPMTTESEIGGLPIRVPAIDIHTIGAGGGSLARVDAGGALRVGPESAGADPGPVCYGVGRGLTVTDAHLLLGRLDPEYFLGGRMALDRARAEAVAADFADQLHVTIPELAAAVLRVANANMERAIRLVSIGRGHDPRRFALVAFGGAGGMHAGELAADVGIATVLVPRFAGVLSALGTLLADVTRDYSAAVLEGSDAVSTRNLQRRLAALVARAARDLSGEGFGPTRRQYERLIDVRYVGQSFELTVPWSRALRARLPSTPRARLRLRQPTPADRGRGRPRARDRTGGQAHPAVPMAGAPDGAAPDRTPPGAVRRPRRRNLVLPVAGSGARCPGPRPGHRHRTRGDRGRPARLRLRRRRGGQSRALEATRMNALDLDVFKNQFLAIAEEMGMTLCRTAFSPNIKERLDYSCAVYDARGETIAQGDHMPVHLGAMPLSVRAAIDATEMGRGDMTILNDPFRGGTHLPDITLVAPVYLGRESRPTFYVANRAHHSDVGGMSPGSMPVARELFQEGLIIPPVQLVRRGRINRDVLAIILDNVRTPDEREGDLSAQIAANRVGEARLVDLVRRYGRRAATAAAAALQAYTERAVRATIRSIPNGRYAFEDVLDDDGVGETPIAIRATVHITGDRATIDFTGTDPQVAGGVNANYAITLSACVYVFRCLVRDDVLYNAGVSRPLTVVAPEGTVVNARRPAAVAGGNVETSQRIADVVFGAIGKAAPDRAPAASQGTMNNVTLGGIHPATGRRFAYYETIGGGMGGRKGAAGLDGVHTHMSNTRNTPVEAIERYLPIRIRQYRIRAEGAGAGAFRGGHGIVREYEMLADASITLLSERRRFAPYGARGGRPGGLGRNTLVRDGQEHPLPGKVSLELHVGDSVRIETPGGGGYGKPRG